MLSSNDNRLLVQSLKRNASDFALSGIGIVIGIATLVFFTSLGAGIKSFVLEDIFVIRKLEVVPPKVNSGGLGNSLWGSDQSTGLADETLEKIRGLPSVETAYPKMKLTFPASLKGGKEFVGKNLVAEFVGDGIPSEYIQSEESTEQSGVSFRDWENRACRSDADCGEGFECRESRCRGRSCRTPSECSSPSYCNEWSNRCEMPVPVVASPRMIEMFNSSLHTALSGAAGMVSNLPKLSTEMLVGFEFDLVLGESLIGRAKKGNAVRKKMRLVGFSQKAIDIGATIPLGYAKRWNQRWGVEGASQRYDSVVVEVQSNAAVASVASRLTNEFELALSDDYRQARRVGFLITLLTVVFNLISLAILIISAIHIAHTFSMVILERRREFGLMRAVGATKWNIRRLVLTEAVVVGAIGAILGIFLGVGLMELVDFVFVGYVPAFPFKPGSLFVLNTWILWLGVGVSILFCLIGAILPAIRASSIDPAEVLSGR